MQGFGYATSALVVWCAISSRSIAADRADRRVATDVAALRGKWILIRSDSGGRPARPEDLQGRHLVVTDDVMFESLVGDSPEARFQLGPASNPKRITLNHTDGPDSPYQQRGIYRYDEQFLHMCLSPPGVTLDGSVPRSFETDGTPNSHLVYHLQYRLPEDWKQISAGFGVEVYERAYGSGGEGFIRDEGHDYVVAVDLRQATLRHMIGSPVEEADEPIEVHAIDTYWNAGLDANSETRKLKVVINGADFDRDPLLQVLREKSLGGVLTEAVRLALADATTTISYGLTKDGRVYSFGTKVDELPNRRRHLLTVSFDDRLARIAPWSREVFNAGLPNVIGCIDTDYPVDALTSTGRTLLGLRDSDRDQRSETVLFFISDSATQALAVESLAEFGVERAQMARLDGGGSSRLIVDGEEKVRGHAGMQVLRYFPHVISVYMGK